MIVPVYGTVHSKVKAAISQPAPFPTILRTIERRRPCSAAYSCSISNTRTVMKRSVDRADSRIRDAISQQRRAVRMGRTQALACPKIRQQLNPTRPRLQPPAEGYQHAEFARAVEVAPTLAPR
ncbi:hypothetical protein NDN16_16400 [Aureimonas altamirensis]|uniref:hypothetical protein n=1 Tax=Aureimonas altamirensis TaxID=370622 RepID=UPI0020374DEA|nr:hypothetical protein [Aureimonas altamirensis]MCM2505250.1 hypothetical protein [Aureimonas altamirensis]